MNENKVFSEFYDQTFVIAHFVPIKSALPNRSTPINYGHIFSHSPQQKPPLKHLLSVLTISTSIRENTVTCHMKTCCNETWLYLECNKYKYKYKNFKTLLILLYWMAASDPRATWTKTWNMQMIFCGPDMSSDSGQSYHSIQPPMLRVPQAGCDHSSDWLTNPLQWPMAEQFAHSCYGNPLW